MLIKMRLPVESGDDDDLHPEDCHCGEDSNDSYISDDSEMLSNKNQIKAKRKITTSSSLETFAIKIRTEDSLINELANILPECGGNIVLSELDSNN